MFLVDVGVNRFIYGIYIYIYIYYIHTPFLLGSTDSKKGVDLGNVAGVDLGNDMMFFGGWKVFFFGGVFLNKGFCLHRFSCNSFCLPWKQVTSVLQPSVEKPAPSAEKPAPWPSAEKPAPWPSAEKFAPLPSAEKSVPLPSAEKPAGAAGEIALLVLLGLEMKKGCWFMVVCFPYTKSGKWISAISIAKVTRRDSNYFNITAPQNCKISRNVRRYQDVANHIWVVPLLKVNLV